MSKGQNVAGIQPITPHFSYDRYNFTHRVCGSEQVAYFHRSPPILSTYRSVANLEQRNRLELKMTTITTGSTLHLSYRREVHD